MPIILNSFSKVFSILKKSDAVRQSAILSFGTITSGVMLALAFILVSRVMGPEKFGILSVSISLMTILLKIPDLGLNQVMLKLLGNWHTNKANIQQLLSAFMGYKLLLSTLLLIFGLILIPWLAAWLSFPHPTVLAITIVGAATFFVYDYTALVLAAQHNFVWLNVINMLQAAIKLAGFMLLIWWQQASVLAIAGIYYLAVPITGIIGLWKFSDTLLIKPTLGNSQLRQQLKKIVLHAGAGTIFYTLITNIDLLFVQSSLNAFDTGIYAGATRIAMFITFLSTAVSGVLNNRVARYQSEKLLRTYLRKSTLVVLLAIGGFITFLPLAKYVVLFSIGAEYLPGLDTIILLVLNAFLGLAVVPYIAVFYAVNRPSYFSISGAIQLVVILLGNWLFLNQYGLPAAAYSRVVATLLLIAYTMFILWQEMHNSTLPLGKKA